MLRVAFASCALLLAIAVSPATGHAATWKVCFHPDRVIINPAANDSGIVVGRFRILGSRHECSTVYAVARKVSTIWGRSGYRTLPSTVRHGGRTLRCRYQGAGRYNPRRTTCGGKYRFDMSPGGE